MLRRPFVVMLVFATALCVTVSAAQAEGHDVKIVDNGYEPATLTVQAGEPVTWTNTGQLAHTVVSDEGSELDSGSLAPGEAYGHVFEHPGRYAYHCRIHGTSMAGTVVVEAAPATSAGPSTSTSAPPSGTLPPDLTTRPASGSLPPTTEKASPAKQTSSKAPFVIAAALVIAIAGGVTLLVVRRRRRSPTM